MKTSVAVAARLPLDACSDQPCDTEVAPRYRTRREHLQAAMQRLDVEANDVAIDWHCHHSYVGAVLRGEKAWPEDRVAQLPPALRVALAEEECRDLGLVTGPLAALLGALDALVLLASMATSTRRPMLKADLPAAAKKAAR